MCYHILFGLTNLHGEASTRLITCQIYSVLVILDFIRLCPAYVRFGLILPLLLFSHLYSPMCIFCTLLVHLPSLSDSFPQCSHLLRIFLNLSGCSTITFTTKKTPLSSSGLLEYGEHVASLPQTKSSAMTL